MYCTAYNVWRTLCKPVHRQFVIYFTMASCFLALALATLTFRWFALLTLYYFLQEDDSIFFAVPKTRLLCFFLYSYLTLKAMVDKNFFFPVLGDFPIKRGKKQYIHNALPTSYCLNRRGRRVNLKSFVDKWIINWNVRLLS